MTDVYERLAKRLDELPQGFPATDTGVELKILRRIFTPEDAEVAIKLRGVKEFKAPYIVAGSNFVADIDQDSCSECGVCAEERCPMDAIEEEGGGFRVLSDLCIGCGVCTVTCPTESITLVRRPESEQDQPPEDMKDWSIKRSVNRGIDLKL